LARVTMVTQPRITQVMNLLHLAPDIQEEILFLPKVLAGRDPIHEKQLRRICQEPSFARQRRMWQILKRSRMEEPATGLGLPRLSLFTIYRSSHAAGLS
jgi:hypothetical protein